MDSRGATPISHSCDQSVEALERRMLTGIVVSYAGAALIVLAVLVGVGRIEFRLPALPELASHTLKDWSKRFGFDRPNLGGQEHGAELESCTDGVKIS